MKNNQLSKIINTIEGAKKDIASFAENAIDLAMDNEVLENVPIVDYAVKVLNIRDAYKKNKLKQNYVIFIDAVKNLDELEIQKFSKLLFLNEDIANETADAIFEIIAESGKPLKAKLVGNLSVALARENITLEEYNTLVLTVEYASILALRALPSYLSSNDNCHKKGIVGQIRGEGLLNTLGIVQRGGAITSLNTTGLQLAKYGFKINVKDE